MSVTRMGHYVSPETGRKIALTKIGKPRSDETRRKLSAAKRGQRVSPRTEFKKGIVPWNKGKTNVYSLEVRRRMGEAHRGLFVGEKSARWRGGITPLHLKIRNSTEYKLWRKAVFERDEYACVIGGNAHGRKLQADHIKPFSKYPELRFDVNNGRTLCEDCHRKTPTYGGRALAA